MEILKCFIEFKFNCKEEPNYLCNINHYTVREKFIRDFYTAIREAIYKYYVIQYASEDMGNENSFQFYSTDESLFSHDINGKKLQILGVTENSSKYFRSTLAFNRDVDTLKAFITSNFAKGINLATDCWSWYDWINARNSGYGLFEHIHGHNYFGRGIETNNLIESIWAIKNRNKINL